MPILRMKTQAQMNHIKDKKMSKKKPLELPWITDKDPEESDTVNGHIFKWNYNIDSLVSCLWGSYIHNNPKLKTGWLPGNFFAGPERPKVYCFHCHYRLSVFTVSGEYKVQRASCENCGFQSPGFKDFETLRKWLAIVKKRVGEVDTSTEEARRGICHNT